VKGVGSFSKGVEGGNDWAFKSLPERGIFRKFISKHQQEKRQHGMLWGYSIRIDFPGLKIKCPVALGTQQVASLESLHGSGRRIVNDSKNT